MLCHITSYVHLVLATLTIITCLFGDNFIEDTRHPLLKALADNATHAVIGALSAISYVVHFYDSLSNVTGWLIIFSSFVISSFIDLDHFIEARTLSLEMATTSLDHRPFLHCSTILVFMLFVCAMLSCLNYFKSSLAFGVFCIAFITHHTRDATRRGYWFCLFGHTRKVPYHLYITLTVVTPHLIFLMYMMCRSNYIQSISGSRNNIKYHEVPRTMKYSVV